MNTLILGDATGEENEGENFGSVSNSASVIDDELTKVLLESRKIITEDIATRLPQTQLLTRSGQKISVFRLCAQTALLAGLRLPPRLDNETRFMKHHTLVGSIVQ